MRSKADVDACEAEQRMTVTVMIAVVVLERATPKSSAAVVPSPATPTFSPQFIA